jgi:hypothetical protein
VWQATIAIPTSATRPSHLLALIFFSTVTQAPLDHSAERRLTHLNSTSYIEKLVPLAVGSPGAVLYVLLEQVHGALAQLRSFAWSLPWYERALLAESLEIPLDCRAVNCEPTSGLALRDPLSYGFHYLLRRSIE